MMALAAISYAVAFCGILCFSILGHADDRVLLTGNHPTEVESFRQLGEANSITPLQMRIRFALHHQAVLEHLLAEQQNPASTSYHSWLSADEFLSRFGPSQSEKDAVTKWLTVEGFSVAPGNDNALEFTDPVALAQRSFEVRIARFFDGSVYANTSDPGIPKRFASVIAAVLGMDNMAHAVPMTHQRGNQTEASIDRAVRLAMGESDPIIAISEAILHGSSAFGPADLRTFYDEMVGTGKDGTGSCIAIVGMSDFLDSTMTTFASQFGLPPIQYTRVLSGVNPGRNGAEAESELDLQWSHVTAPGSSVNFYLGGDLVSDIARAVNSNQCGVISISYGFCGEQASFMKDAIDPLFQQAAAQGQSVFVSSGDQGAAGLGLSEDGTSCVINKTRSVNELSADPNVTSVGGTQFKPVYLNGNDQGYASEEVWNDSSGATGGGASQVFAKPAYQKGAGVPIDGARDVPDLALIASPNSPGVLFADDVNGTAQIECCIGGTSLSAPVWAGFATVIGQISGNTRLGNFNQIIYPLANTQYAISGFHDLTNGNNNYNSVIGFNAGPGFDQATGWGSVDFEVFADAVKTYLPKLPTLTPTATFTGTPVASRTPRATATRTPPAATTSPTAIATRTVSARPTRRRTPMPTATSSPAPPIVSATPGMLSFATIPVGRFSLQRLSIRNRGSSTLSVNVSALAAPFTIYFPGNYRIPPGWTLELLSSFIPVQTGAASAQLGISTNDPNNPTLTIQVAGVATDSTGNRRKSMPHLSQLQPRWRRTGFAK
jgi:subtilase family serine protease